MNKEFDLMISENEYLIERLKLFEHNRRGKAYVQEERHEKKPVVDCCSYTCIHCWSGFIYAVSHEKSDIPDVSSAFILMAGTNQGIRSDG